MPDFNFNYRERADLGEIIYRDGAIKQRSVDRQIQRIQKGTRPKDPALRALVDEIVGTDGLVIPNEDFDPALLAGAEVKTVLEEIADDAGRARRAAERIIEEGQIAIAAVDLAKRTGGKTRKGDSTIEYVGVVVEVRIERVNEGEGVTYYDLFEGREVTQYARKYEEFYALWVTRAYVEVEQ